MIATIIGLVLLGLLYPFTRIARKQWPQLASIIWAHRFKIILAVLLLIGIFDRTVLYGAIWLTIIWAVLRFIQWRRRVRSGWYMPEVLRDEFGTGKRSDAVNDGDFDAVIAAGVVGTWKEHAHAAGLSVRMGEASQNMQGLAHNARRPSDGLGGFLEVREYNKTKRMIQAMPGRVIDADGIYQVPELLHSERSPIGPRFMVSVLPGASLRTYEAAAEALAVGLGVVGVGFSQDGYQRSQGVIQMDVRLRDSLAVGATSEGTFTDFNQIPVAIREDGQTWMLSVANQSAMLVGGLPGSGKSAAMTNLIGQFLPKDNVQVSVVDGKGGADWEWVEPRAAVYTNEDEDLARVLEIVTRLQAIMRWRLRHMKEVRGTSNFWKQGPTPDMPLMVLVMDEIQTFLDKTEIQGTTDEDTKRQKAISTQIHGRLSQLVKKGRSAGMFTILMTQKPTADAIPTNLRSNAGLSVGFRVMNAETVKAIYGDYIEPSPTDISTDTPGVAVLPREDGAGYERVRFFYLDEQRAEVMAQENAHHRRELTQFPTEIETNETDETEDAA